MTAEEILEQWAATGVSLHHVIARAYDDDRWAWGNDPESEAVEIDALCTRLAREPALVHVADGNGRTLLHVIAEELGCVDEDRPADGERLLARALETCLALGASVDARDAQGMTPLYFASDPRWMTRLLAAGADPNATTDAGATALMHAVQDVDRVRTLLAHGADPDLRDPRGRTARDWATYFESTATLALLDNPP